jgi:hypothetical protein
MVVAVAVAVAAVVILADTLVAVAAILLVDNYPVVVGQA